MLSSNNLKVKPIIIVEKLKIIHSTLEIKTLEKEKFVW